MITIYDWFGYELPMEMRYQLIKEAGVTGSCYGGAKILGEGITAAGRSLPGRRGCFWKTSTHLLTARMTFGRITWMGRLWLTAIYSVLLTVLNLKFRRW